jgi:hypothetical protein
MTTVEEKFQGLRGDRKSREIDFIVKDASDETDALTATAVYIGVNYGFERDNIPLSGISVSELAYHKGLYETTASFSVAKQEDPETNDVEVSFDLNLDTRRIYRSYETTNSYEAAGVDAKSYHQQINVQEDGTTDGADVRVPVGGFQVSWYAPQASVTESYRTTVLGMVGKTNNDTFYGHSAGEVLFAGVAGRARNTDDWELVFRFETSPNQTGLTIGESPHTITGVDVQGWEVLWVDYEHKTENDLDVSYPVRAYTERVYESADFSLLGVGS